MGSMFYTDNMARAIGTVYGIPEVKETMLGRDLG